MNSLFLVVVLLLQSMPPAPPAQEAVTAESVLERALAYQRGDSPVTPPGTFRGRFYVTARNPQDGSSINLSVERLYARAPERLWTHSVDSVVGSDSTVVYDRGDAWFRDNATGKVVVYSEDPATFQTDLEQLDGELRLMPVFLDAVVLDALVPRLQEPVFAGEHTLEVPRQGEVSIHRVRARVVDDLFGPDFDAPPPMPGDPPPSLELELDVDVGTGQLWAVRLRTLSRVKERRLELRFKLHIETEDGLKVPGNVKVYEDGSDVETLNFGLEFVDTPEGSRVEFELDPELDPARFAVPEDRG